MEAEHALYQLARLFGVGRRFRSLRNITAYLEVTTRCQNTCTFCPILKLNRRRGDVTDAVRDRTAALMAANPDTRFRAYLHLVGEPLLYPKLEEYVRLLTGLPNVEL